MVNGMPDPDITPTPDEPTATAEPAVATAPATAGIEPPQQAPATPRSLAARSRIPGLEPVLFYLLALLGGGFCLLLCGHNPSGDTFTPILGSVVAMLTFGMAFHRVNPRWVGIQLIAMILATFYILPMYGVLWMAAGALGGGALAWLLRQPWREADFMIWPPLVIAAAFIALVWLASAMQLAPAYRAGAQWLQGQSALMNELSGEFYRSGLVKLPPEQIKLVQHYTPWMLTGSSLFLWYAMLWGAGRLARRLLGPPARHPRAALIFFKLEPRHILPLIAALILAILNGLTGRVEAMAWAFPLFLLIGLAGLAAGCGVVFFRAALWRAQGRTAQARWLVLGFILVTGFWMPVGPVAVVLLGIADTWLDFRRLRHLAIPLGHKSS